MLKFPKIGQFRQAISEVKYRADYVGKDELGNPIYQHTKEYPTLCYVGTVKLHGTNASVVRHPDGTFTAQSRRRVLSSDDDNAGFHKFVFDEVGLEVWDALIRDFEGGDDYFADKPIAIYGEWCGSGIQSGVAISKLPKMFVIFAVRVGEEEETEWFNPEMIGSNNDIRIYNISHFPTFRIEIDFENPKFSQNRLVELTRSVEKACPVGWQFGSDGIGEGIVWRCVTPGFEDSRFWFKTKGEKHSVSKVKTLAPVDTEKLESVNAFVDYAVTEARLEQGLDVLREQGKPLTRKSTGDYLRWIVNDVMSEESDTMEESGLTPKDVNKFVSGKARLWYFNWIDSNL